jgi:hypothetical protein
MQLRSAPLRFVFTLACFCSTLSASGDNGLFTGVWRGKIDKLPGVTMVISDEGGDLTGAVLFYLIRRDNGEPPKSTPGDPEPMFHIKLSGDSLDFQVSHRRAHPPRTLHDPPVTFHLKLTGKDQAILIRGHEENNPFLVFRDK